MSTVFRSILMLSILLSILLPFSLDASAAPQEQGGDQEKKSPTRVEDPAKGGANATISDITAHRGGTIPFVRSYEDRVDLDLESVDYDADVLAVIDGFPVTQEMFRAYLVMFVGGLEINRFLTAMLSEMGKERRIKEGADPGLFEITEEAIDREIQNQIKFQQQQQKMPEIDLEEYKTNIDAAYGWDRYRDLIKATMIFSKVYLPEDPAAVPEEEKVEDQAEEGRESDGEDGEAQEGEEEEEEAEEALDPNLPIGTNKDGKQVNIFMPMVTWEVLSHRDRDKDIRDYINSIYENGQYIQDFMKPQFSRLIKEALIRDNKLEFFYSGNLKPGVLFRIENLEQPLDEIYAVVKPRVSKEDMQLALREILTCKAMDRALKERGCLLSDEEFNEAFKAHEAVYEGTIFPLEFMIQLYGYLNMDRYKNIYHRRAGFEKLFAGELSDDAKLMEFYNGPARLFYEHGTVKVQAVFFGVFDHEKKVLREDGYAWAHAQMAEVQKALADGEDFETVAKRYTNPEGTFTTYDFGRLNRRDLRMTFGDSAKSALISGVCLSDYIFYRAKEGEIIGPITRIWSDLGNWSHKGVYLVKVIDFRRGQPLTPYEQRKDMIKVDYADLKFVDWSQEALKSSDIQLTKEG